MIPAVFIGCLQHLQRRRSWQYLRLPMPVITNVGGSITSAVALTLLAWAVRFIRSRAERQRRRQAHSRAAGRASGRYSTGLSPAALRMLVWTHAALQVLCLGRLGRDLACSGAYAKLSADRRYVWREYVCSGARHAVL